MEEYSTVFLSEDWDGAGMDLAACCVFGPDQMTDETVFRFLDRMREIVCVTLLTYVDPSGYVELAPSEFATSFREALHWPSCSLLSANIQSVSTDFTGVVELSRPDQFLISAPTESYYTGKTKYDRQIANEIAKIVSVASLSFGNGHVAFGAGCTAYQIATRQRSMGTPPNVTAGGDIVFFAEEVFEKCADFRPNC